VKRLVERAGGALEAIELRADDDAATDGSA